MKAVNFLLTLLLTITMMSCQRESVDPSNTPVNSTITGKWFNDPQNVYAQGDTTSIVANGNQFIVTELDYVIYQPVVMTYDPNSNYITINGTQGQYTVTGTGYLIGSNTLHLDYTVTPGMVTQMHSNWYK